MIFFVYVMMAFIVIWLSGKCAKYIDLIEKNTSLSGAFVGGIILAAVTSLPELFSTISATVFLNKPQIVIGNILGSNILNMTVLGVVLSLFLKNIRKKKLEKTHLKTITTIIIIYIIIFSTVFYSFEVNFLTISSCSLAIILLYYLSVRSMKSEHNEKEKTNVNLKLKSVILKFILTAILLVLSSICITYIVDFISINYSLGSTFAGALFLGVATSLPEIASTISLAKMGNMNAAIGNILGSILFNFNILALADFIYLKKSIYKTVDILSSHCANLIIYGMLCGITVCLMVVINNLKVKNRLIYLFLSLVSVGCYLAFLSL